ncbi:MAG: CRISPR-associated protein Cas4 [Leptospira sp.]|nr:MAG: CRISPR-associated protein Cas4 [Leptospira sp.]
MEMVVNSMKNYTTLHSLPISLLRQYVFCPRIPYYSELLGFNSNEPLWTEQGQKFHSDIESLIKRRLPSKFGLANPRFEKRMNVVSFELNLHGIVDYTFYNDEYVVPIEFKISGNKPTRGQELQLLAYGYALSEMKNLNFERGYFLFGNNKKPYSVFPSEEKKKDIIKIVNQIKNDQITMLLPESAASINKCTQCEFLNLCNDRNF